jgi:hypothetical protein
MYPFEAVRPNPLLVTILQSSLSKSAVDQDGCSLRLGPGGLLHASCASHMCETLMPNCDFIRSSVQKYYMLASVALLFYDLVATLDIEVARVWRGKFSAFIILWSLVSCPCFILRIVSLAELTWKQNRWLPVLGYIFVVWLAHSTGISTNVRL